MAVLALIAQPDAPDFSVRLALASALLGGLVAAVAANLLRGLPGPTAE